MAGATQAPGADPRIRVIDVAFDPRIPLFRLASISLHRTTVAPEEDHTVNAGPLCRRLAAIRVALSKTCRARRSAMPAGGPVLSRPAARSACWPATGPPPGLRGRHTREVDEILSECHWLARHAAATDTS